MNVKSMLSQSGWDLNGDNGNLAALSNIGAIYFVDFSKRPSAHIHVYDRRSFSAAEENPGMTIGACVQQMHACYSQLYTSKRLSLTALKKQRVFDILASTALSYVVQTRNYAVHKQLMESAASENIGCQFVIIAKKDGQAIDFRPAIVNRSGNKLLSQVEVISYAESVLQMFS